MFGSDAFKGLFETLLVLAIIGSISLLCGTVYGIYWLYNHVEILVK